MKSAICVLLALFAITPLWGQISPSSPPLTVYSPVQPEALHSSSTSSGRSWMQLGDGLSGGVISMAMLNNELYVVHYTSQLAQLSSICALSKWDGLNWTRLSTFQLSGTVECIAAYHDELYIGGDFLVEETHENNSSIVYRSLIKWDGRRFQQVRGGVLDGFTARRIIGMGEFQGELYCTGTFEISTSHVTTAIRFNGTKWSMVGNAPGGSYSDPSLPGGRAFGRRMLNYKGELYLGGAFYVNGVRACLAKWDGSTWTAVSGINSSMVTTLEVFQDKLYCYTPKYYLSDDTDKESLKRWDGQKWEVPEEDMPLDFDDVEDMISYKGELYAGGSRKNTGDDKVTTAIVRFNGTEWSTVTAFRSHEPGGIQFQAYQARLHAGGMFTRIDAGAGIPLKHIGAYCDDGLCGSISGTVFNDRNSDCTRDGNEKLLPFRLVEILPGPMYAATDNSGRFYRALPLGDYTVSVVPHEHWSITCPAPNGTHSVSIAEGDDTADDLVFGMYAEPIKDVRVSMAGSAARAGRQMAYHISYRNFGTVTMNGTIRLILDGMLRYDSSSPAPDRMFAPLLEWDFTDLEPEETRRIVVWVTLPTTAQRGQIICSEVTLVPNEPASGIDLRDSVCQEVIGSYDPNDISVVPLGIERNGEITSRDSVLTYTVRFQNTGNDTAFKVVVVDTLSSHLDLRTIRLGAASHPFTFSISGRNVLTWTFDDIMLPDSNVNEPMSHGLFKYSVHLKPGLPVGTVIPNRASIYFDYNEPVITNTVRSVISILLSVPDPAENASVAFFPNPVLGSMRITGEIQSGSTITVLDLLGRTMLEQRCDGGDMTVNMGALPPGTYFVKVPVRDGTVLRQVSVMR